MEVTSQWFLRWTSAVLVVALMAPTSSLAQTGADSPQQDGVVAQPSQDQSSPSQAQPAAASSQTDSSPLPDNPAPVTSGSTGSASTSSESTGSESNDQSEPSAKAPSPPQPVSHSNVQEPVGTAAAEQEKTTGVAASKPAGTAIAPAKQRRTRMIIIKVSALLGAGVAIGTVAALSNASPSRPPGSH